MNWKQLQEESEIYKYIIQEEEKEYDADAAAAADDDDDEVETVEISGKLLVEFSSIHELSSVVAFTSSVDVLCSIDFFQTESCSTSICSISGIVENQISMSFFLWIFLKLQRNTAFVHCHVTNSLLDSVDLHKNSSAFCERNYSLDSGHSTTFTTGTAPK